MKATTIAADCEVSTHHIIVVGRLSLHSRPVILHLCSQLLVSTITGIDSRGIDIAHVLEAALGSGFGKAWAP